MSSTRSKLQLDEQSFQGLLSAAYTIQEHADLLKGVTQVGGKATHEPEGNVARVCRHCGAPLIKDASRCDRCGWEESHPAERALPKTAAIQEHPSDGGEPTVDALASSGSGVVPEAASRSAESGVPDQDAPRIETERETDGLIEANNSLLSIPLATTEDNWLTDASHRRTGLRSVLGDLRQQFDHHRANFYLGLAVLVAVLALFWPGSAAPQGPHLDPWQRILVGLGVAEAPPPQIHYRGDPNVQVWVDPHTALYYCAGDEQFGKAAGGRLTTQRDAQIDQFEPANRAACN